MQFPLITYGIWHCINDNIIHRQNINIVKIYVHVHVYASELRKYWHFYIIKVLFISIWMGRNNHYTNNAH